MLKVDTFPAILLFLDSNCDSWKTTLVIIHLILGFATASQFMSVK